MTWTTVELDSNGFVYHRVFQGSHDKRIAWSEAGLRVGSDYKLVAIVAGNHTPFGKSDIEVALDAVSEEILINNN